jgi:hypothetical protein
MNVDVVKESLAPTVVTNAQVAIRWDCSIEKVEYWIRTGQLRALNMSKDPNGMRAKWRIRIEDLLAFEESRASYRRLKRQCAKRA